MTMYRYTLRHAVTGAELRTFSTERLNVCLLRYDFKGLLTTSKLTGILQQTFPGVQVHEV